MNKKVGVFKTRDYEVWANHNLSFTEMKVFNALVCFIDFTKGSCFPSQELLCEYTGLKARANISRTISSLIDKGLVHKYKKTPVESSGWCSNVYHILNYRNGKIYPPRVVKHKLLTENQLDKMIEETFNV